MLLVVLFMFFSCVIVCCVCEFLCGAMYCVVLYGLFLVRVFFVCVCVCCFFVDRGLCLLFVIYGVALRELLFMCLCCLCVPVWVCV